MIHRAGIEKALLKVPSWVPNWSLDPGIDHFDPVLNQSSERNPE